ncbi:MAG: HDOD domain-containing protein [Oscillospiraceae bacterium]|jgi:EAL and modified HD-GYP domain-containing signal transduction protein|nr:HDOD domain-containing protein [Oscillospiraceae bacterium]
MELLIIPVPLFDKDMAVEAYFFRYQRGNDYNSALQTTAVFDGATLSPPLETLNLVGIDAFTVDQPVFVPVSGIAILGGNLGTQCKQPPDKIVFLVGNDVKPEEPYISNMQRLRDLGFRFAFRDVKDKDMARMAPVLALGDFIFLDTRELNQYQMDDCLKLLNRSHRNLRVVAAHVDTAQEYERLKKTYVSLFEGHFYRVPLTRGQTEVSPLKANLIRLLNIVRDENFEFDVVSDIVQRDTALSLSLMRMVNSPFLGLRQKINTINHAVTILGQNEVRKWVTTSVSRSLGADKPNEITRLSLVRAKFAENLAPKFKLERDSQGLFLMGLFSVLDIILEMSMEDALKLVQVSDDIGQALISKEGRFAPVMRFIEYYEMADWAAVSRELILFDLTANDIYDAYIEAIAWYSDLILEEVRPNRNAEDQEEEETAD